MSNVTGPTPVTQSGRLSDGTEPTHLPGLVKVSGQNMHNQKKFTEPGGRAARL
jgi:hypothetical protein